MRLRTRRPATSPMTDLDKLLRQYIERFESGGDVDPSDLIAQAETGEQAQLRELIAGYLEHAAPGREWDAAAFDGSVAERAVARTAEEWSAAAGELAGRAGAAAERARDHARGSGHPPRRLPRCLGRSGEGRAPTTTGWSGECCRPKASPPVFGRPSPSCSTPARRHYEEPGRRRDHRRPTEAASAYARTAPPPPPEYATTESSEEESRVTDKERSEEPDEVDRLFTGG